MTIGRFLERMNRFVARVAVEGSIELAHVPDTGRMTGVLEPGCRVELEGPSEPPRKLRWSMTGAWVRNTLVGTVPARANSLFAEAWRSGMFPELAGEGLRAEVRVRQSRFDFQTGETLVEVKSVTLASSGIGRFPDAVTARGSKHLRELTELALRKRPCAVVFAAQRGDVERIELAHEIDPLFAQEAERAGDAGVLILGCRFDMTRPGAQGGKRVDVRWLGQEGFNR